MPIAPTEQIGAVILEIDGTISGTVLFAQGGDGIAPVVEEHSRDQWKKHIQPPEWQDLKLGFHLPVHRTVSDWITTWWRREDKPRTVRLTAVDPGQNVIRRYEFQRALITETTIFELGTGPSEILGLELKLTPEFVRPIPPPLETVIVPIGPPPLASFRLELPGLDCRKVKIDSFTVKQPPTDMVSSPDSGEVLVRPPLSFPNLTVTLPERSAATWQAWFKDFVVKGNNADTQEKTGRLLLLDEQLRERVQIGLFNVGIFRLTLSAWTHQEFPQVVAGLYCERMDFAVL